MDKPVDPPPGRGVDEPESPRGTPRPQSRRIVRTRPASSETAPTFGLERPTTPALLPEAQPQPRPEEPPALRPPGRPASAEGERIPAPPRRTPVVRVTRSVDVPLGEHTRAARRPRSRFTGWLYGSEAEGEQHAKPWYQVLCLTGVDYFSTLGYQPGIAFLAAGLLSPVATLILVIFTLVAALPTYSRVAAESPHGQGSIAMLERLLPRWRGKLFVLCLLGFAATSWIITITLSAADATAHVIENPYFPTSLHHNVGVQIGITAVLILLLGGVFLKGFKEAIGIAVLLVIVYLGLNMVVLVRALAEVGADTGRIDNWLDVLGATRGNPLTWVGASLLIFPRLALGLSGFETGVAVMPVVQGKAGDSRAQPAGRIQNTRKMLAAAALIMSVYLIMSSLATTLLIPEAAFEEGGEAKGRALAYLAHEYLGDIFGTVYDASTIAILWFAGASAMAGLLNLVPQYLPAYGMAPQWATAQRPLALVFTVIALVVTVLFRADVEAQGGAYATGVLSLMASASVAVTISLWRSRSRWVWYFLPITLAFFYITFQNIRVEPSGLLIAVCFIVGIVVTSVVSRVLRSTELRFSHVVLDRTAGQMISAATRAGVIYLITHDPRRGTDAAAYEAEVKEARRRHLLGPDDPFLLLEVRGDDPSVFADELHVTGHSVGAYDLLRCDGPAVANAIAALAIAMHGRYGSVVHLFMRWTPINSILDAIGEGVEFLLWGGGDMARLVELELRREAVDESIIVHAA